jgi:hypothetical protein
MEAPQKGADFFFALSDLLFAPVNFMPVQVYGTE